MAHHRGGGGEEDNTEKEEEKEKKMEKMFSDVSLTKKSKLRTLWNENFEEDAPFVKLKRRKSENLLPN